MSLLKACLRANEQYTINRYPAYQRMKNMARILADQSHMLSYMSNEFLTDLLTWYHIVWLRKSVHSSNNIAQRLVEQDRSYTLHRRRELLALINELLSGVLPRYKKLTEQGRIELSVSPYRHLCRLTRHLCCLS